MQIKSFYVSSKAIAFVFLILAVVRASDITGSGFLEVTEKSSNSNNNYNDNSKNYNQGWNIIILFS